MTILATILFPINISAAYAVVQPINDVRADTSGGTVAITLPAIIGLYNGYRVRTYLSFTGAGGGAGANPMTVGPDGAGGEVMQDADTGAYLAVATAWSTVLSGNRQGTCIEWELDLTAAPKRWLAFRGGP